MKAKTLTTIIASAILTVSLISGCNSTKVPVYSPADPNGNRKLLGHYTSRGLSTGLTVDTYEQKKKYDPNSQ